MAALDMGKLEAGQDKQQGIQLRLATPADCQSLHQWRNHAQVRAYANDAAPIEWETHVRWFQRVLADPNRRLLIADFEDAPLGVLRYDEIESETVLVSIYLVPSRLGKGFGASLLMAGHVWLRQHWPAIHRIEAEVQAQNIASIKVFEKAGYSPATARQLERGTQWYEYSLSANEL